MMDMSTYGFRMMLADGILFTSRFFVFAVLGIARRPIKYLRA